MLKSCPAVMFTGLLGISSMTLQCGWPGKPRIGSPLLEVLGITNSWIFSVLVVWVNWILRFPSVGASSFFCCAGGGCWAGKNNPSMVSISSPGSLVSCSRRAFNRPRSILGLVLLAFWGFQIPPPWVTAGAAKWIIWPSFSWSCLYSINNLLWDFRMSLLIRRSWKVLVLYELPEPAGLEGWEGEDGTRG